MGARSLTRYPPDQTQAQITTRAGIIDDPVLGIGIKPCKYNDFFNLRDRIDPCKQIRRLARPPKRHCHRPTANMHAIDQCHITKAGLQGPDKRPATTAATH